MNFLIFKEIPMGSVAILIYEKGLPNYIYKEMRKYLTI